jgi:hypothetical protein
VGTSRHVKEALRAEGQAVAHKVVGAVLHRWTMQGAYLRAVARGEMRRNLDGSLAGVPMKRPGSMMNEWPRQLERERPKQAGFGNAPEA